MHVALSTSADEAFGSLKNGKRKNRKAPFVKAACTLNGRLDVSLTFNF